MYHWHWIVVICLILLVVVQVDSQSTGDEHVFEFSSCVFSNDSQLQYSCRDPNHEQQGVNSSIKLNTFEVTEYSLCGNHTRVTADSPREAGCKNISLFFLKSEEAGFCIAVTSSTATLKQVNVRLLHYNIYYQYFPICIKPQLLQLKYKHAFSCTTDVRPARKLMLNISGYDTSVYSVWVSTLQINIVHNDSQSVCQNDIAIIDTGHKKTSEQYLIYTVITISCCFIIGCVFGSIIIKGRSKLKHLTRCEQDENKQSIPDLKDSIDSLQYPISQTPSDASNIHQLPNTTTSCHYNSTSSSTIPPQNLVSIVNIMDCEPQQAIPLERISKCYDSQEANTSRSIFSSSVTISTDSDPQEANTTSNSSVTISTDSNPQEVNTTGSI